MREKLRKLKSAWKKYGLRDFIHKLRLYWQSRLIDRLDVRPLLHYSRSRRILREMLHGACERVIVWRSSFGYAVPLFQRPQHIARELAKSGSLVVYEVSRMTDACRFPRQAEPGLWLFPMQNLFFRFMLMRELRRSPLRKYLQFYSTDWQLCARDLRAYQNAGFALIYEYVDHLDGALSGTGQIPKNVQEKFDFVMSDERVLVVATSRALYEDASRRRGGTKRLVLSTNGVDYDFFQRFEPFCFEPAFQRILDLGKPIVCYYGALASWFDYELARKIAATDRYSLVLIGIKYDDSFDRELRNVENVFFLGPRDYRVLKYYARAADVLVIPFLLNALTEATNPVKLFEYMALHKPIVTTALRECRQYRSVLLADSHDDFLQKLDQALLLRNDARLLSLLDKEARDNDWSKKAKIILDHL